MHNFYQASSIEIAIILTISLGSLIQLMFLIYSLPRNKMKSRYYYGIAILSIINLWIMFVYSVGILSIARSVEQKPLIDVFMRIPTLFIFMILLLSIGVLVFITYRLFLHLKHSIVPSSISVGFNALELGICVYEEDGLPRLVNRSMDALSFQLTGKYLYDGNAFFSSIKENSSNHVIDEDESKIVLKHNNTIYRIIKEDFKIKENKYYRILAMDVTEEYNLLIELDKENKKREDYQRRLKEYSLHLDQLTINEEILKTKMNIHSSYGQILLVGKHSLDHEEDRKEFLDRWNKLSNLVFDEDEDDLDELFNMAKNLGIAITIHGKILDIDYKMVVKLLYEVFTNTNKHTNAKNIYLECKDSMYACYNDELSDMTSFDEGGGLSSFRHLAEQNGYVVTYELTPYFKVLLQKGEK